MKILKRLEVQAADFNTFLTIKQKHEKDVVEILRKYYSAVFNKFSSPLKYATDSYSILADEFLMKVAELSKNFSSNIPVKFSFDSSKYFDLSITIDKDGKAGVVLFLNEDTILLEDFKKEAKDLKELFNISQKDFDTAYKKAQSEIEKEYKKWEKE